MPTQPPPPGDATRRVLLVEDNPADRAIVESLLAHADTPTELIHAGSTVEALEMLRAQPVDLVLLDLGLPDAEDMSALARLLSVQSAPPVIVLTGSLEAVHGEASLKMGAEDFLPKELFTQAAAAALLDRSIRYALTRHRQRLMLERESAQLRWVTARQRQFIDNVATGMQGPVTAMYGLVSTLSERHRSLKAAERRLLLDKLGHSAQMLGRRLSDFIADAAPEMQGSPIRRQVSMADVVPAAINAVGERPEGTHVSLAGDLPRVWGRPDALQHAISELIRNAVIHARPGHPPTIQVQVTGYGTGVRITVSDDGPTIPVARRSTVFEPGVTLDERSTRDGLGLTQVRAVVAEHGGAVWIEESALGGTSVSLTVPQRESSRDDDFPDHPMTEPARESRPNPSEAR